MPDDDALWHDVMRALSALSAACLPGGRGWAAAVASIVEATVAKPGNVHPGAAFADLCHADLVAAGLAIAPALDAAADVPLGRTILAAVTAATAVTPSNANLGIVLAIAPLAAADDAPSATVDDPTLGLCRAAAATLSRLSSSDAADVWRAIAIARPGGLGRRAEHDLAGPPPSDLLAAMRLAAPQDAIARLWSDGYEWLRAGLVADLLAALAAGRSLHAAVVDAFLCQLAREPDSLIKRRHGPDVAADVSRRAAAARGDDARIVAFDRFLRSPRRLNPGTTADLTAAGIYMLLRTGRLRPPASPSSPGGSPP